MDTTDVLNLVWNLTPHWCHISSRFLSFVIFFLDLCTSTFASGSGSVVNVLVGWKNTNLDSSYPLYFCRIS